MEELGIEMIAAYSPEARGRSDRAFSTHQQRLPRELALYGIKTMADANRYLQDYYLPAFNAEFACKPAIDDSAFVPLIGHRHEEVLCEPSSAPSIGTIQSPSRAKSCRSRAVAIEPIT